MYPQKNTSLHHAYTYYVYSMWLHQVGGEIYMHTTIKSMFSLHVLHCFETPARQLAYTHEMGLYTHDGMVEAFYCQSTS